MAKQPFNAAGAAAKTAELYALSDSALLVQANLIRANFRTWIKDNFFLNTSQVAYLDAVDNNYIGYMAQNLAMAIQNRRPVTLVAPVTVLEVRASKMIKTTSTLVVNYEPVAVLTVSGALHFEVYYA